MKVNIPDTNINMNVVIEYHIPIGNYRAITRREEYKIVNGWKSGNLIYWYRDRFNVNTISISEIKEIKA